MTDITVKLDINSDPPVTCDPPDFPANRGNQQIKWKTGGSQKFAFPLPPGKALTGLPDPPFSSLNVTSNEITVQDNDTGSGVYGYTVYVISDANGDTYSTLGSRADPIPCIKNN
ncbi:MAG TPA: hypothetical protein VJL61_09695 [Rhodanobacteraceae bacterium]|nr:hypothetical protein [Rhodanobacteraceae bacterium]